MFLSLGTGANRSMHRRSAEISPSLARLMSLRASCSDSSSSNCSMIRVALFRLPGGRPDGLPLVPFAQRPLLVWEFFFTPIKSTQARYFSFARL